MNPLRIFLLAALILTASFPGCLDEDITDSEEINKPIAKIVSINPVNLTIGETVSFTGEGTTDEGYIIGYDWGSSLDGFLSDEKIFSINNLSIGNHTIFFKVQNDDKIWSDRAELGLTVNEVLEVPNQHPQALILMPTNGAVVEAGKPFQIDGSASTDPDGDDLEYMWTLSGLGSPIDLSTKMSDFVTVNDPGNDLVLTLLVKDPDGLTDSSIAIINVEPANRPPVAKILTPSNGGTFSEGSEIVFNGLESSDPDNDLLTYKWDLAEEGVSSYTASKQSKFSVDLSEGNYSVTLTVEDSDEESSSITHEFTVMERKYSAFTVSEFTGNFRPSSAGNLTQIINLTDYILDNPSEFGNTNYSIIWESFNFTFEMNETWESNYLSLSLDVDFVSDDAPQEGPAGMINMNIFDPNGIQYGEGFEIVTWNNPISDRIYLLPVHSGTWVIQISGSGLEGLGSYGYKGNYSLVVESDKLE